MAANVDKRRRFVWGSTGADAEAVSHHWPHTNLGIQMAIQSAVISARVVNLWTLSCVKASYRRFWILNFEYFLTFHRRLATLASTQTSPTLLGSKSSPDLWNSFQGKNNLLPKIPHSQSQTHRNFDGPGFGKQKTENRVDENLDQQHSDVCKVSLFEFVEQLSVAFWTHRTNCCFH